MDEVDKTLGQIAFEAYRAEVNGQTFDDRQIPAWGELHGNRERVHRGWEVAAAAIQQHTRMMDALDKAADGPFVQRDRPSRWRPLEEMLPEPGASDGSDAQRPQVGADRAAAAREAVPVEADDNAW